MKIIPLLIPDIKHIKHLQPEGWPDLVPEFEFYCKYDFCKPYKAIMQDKIVGLGTIVLFNNTAWLSHIIVDQTYRKQGIGQAIVEHLLQELKDSHYKSILLIATPLGRPVYQKCGFRDVSEYSYLHRQKPWQSSNEKHSITEFQKEFRDAILTLDKNITGENRQELLDIYLPQAQLVVKYNKVEGYYFPNLREGAIYATNSNAGIELMKLKYAIADKAVLPSENKLAIKFLEEQGFQHVPSNGTRMIFGDNIPWQPEMFYSRIAGNFG